MSVFRRPQGRNYFASKRNWMQDPRLSIKATGLQAKMLSMPADWEFHQSELKRRLKDGESSIRSAMMELVKYGYLIKHPRHRLENGHFGGMSYEVWDESQLDVNSPLSDEQVERIFSNSYCLDDYDEIYGIQKIIPELGFPVLDASDLGNQGLQVKELTNPTDKEDNKPAPPETPAAVVVFSCLNELKIPDSLKHKLAKDLDEDKATQLVKRVLRWKTRKCDIKACHTVLTQWDTWSEELTEEEKQEIKDEQDAKEEVLATARKERATKIHEAAPHLELSVGSNVLNIKIGNRFSPIGFRDENIDRVLDALEKKIK